MLNNFIYAESKDLFLEQLEAGNILDEAIVFIEDTKEIWNHGTYFAQKEETESSSLIFDTDAISLSDYSLEERDDMFIQYTLDEEACVACCGKTISDFQNCINNTNIYLKWKGLTVPITAAGEGILIFKSETTVNSNIFHSPHRSILFTFSEENGSQKIDIIDQVWLDEIMGLEIVLNITDDTGPDVLYSYANTQTDVTAALLSNMNSSSVIFLMSYLANIKKPMVLKIGNFYIPLSTKMTEGSNLILMFSTLGQGFQLTFNGTSIILHGDYSFGYGATNTSSSTTEYIENITYSQLVALKNNSNLVKGKQYRITDYITTTAYENTQSANHSFDLIVIADDTNILNEKARAIQREGATYFDGQHLEAWQVWYCIDNDINRFAWADTTNGKGVIYRLIDEKQNDCPYDFKNIMFTHPTDTTTYPDYYFTFTNFIDSVITDVSLTWNCYNNCIKAYYNGTYQINRNLILHKRDIEESYDNLFEFDCYDNFLYTGCNSNSFDSKCSKNIICGSVYNTFGKCCRRNELSPHCNYNTFQDACENNSLGNLCQYNFFGNGCINNSFRKSAATDGKLRQYCWYNYFSPGCKNNVIWNSAFDITNPLQNIKVHAGVSGASADSCNIINITTAKATYEINVAKNSSGEIKIYCDADLVQ